MIFSLLSSFIVGSVFAQESPEDTARKHGITFPINELGGCADYASCRSYCEDPLNHDACMAFAKSKGFYKDSFQDRKSAILTAAKRELGCERESSCRVLCEQEQNFEKCNAFAQKYAVQGGHAEDPTESKILEKAKQFLGCSSYSSCMSFCQKEENQQKCSEFANQVGLRGGEHHAGPGGCTTEESCRAFCENPDNYNICKQYNEAQGGQFRGPGGCNSEETCRKYCQEHEQECQTYFKSSYGDYNHQEMCQKTPDCSWINDTCQCTKIEGMDPDEYCKKYPDRCSGYSDIQTQCSKYPGCSWTGKRCECSGTYQGGSTTTEPETSSQDYCKLHPDECLNSSGGSLSQDEYCKKYPDRCSGYKSSEDFSKECQQKPNCSWNGSSCLCTESVVTPTSSQSIEPYSKEGGETIYQSECSAAGCTWTGTSCQCPDSKGVQGVSVRKEFFQTLWENFLKFLSIP